MIDWGNGQHKGIIGMTGTGKTYAVTRTLSSRPEGVLLFNTMHAAPGKGWVRATGEDSIAAVLSAVETGHKVNFLPARSREDAGRQLMYILNAIYAVDMPSCIFVIDEVHIYKRKALESILAAITTARNNGFTFAWMSQRLALVDNTIFTQSPEKVVFYLENEDKYMHGYGIPYSLPLDSGQQPIKERILALDPGGMDAGGKYQPSHAYCTYFMGRVEGAYKF